MIKTITLILMESIKMRIGYTCLLIGVKSTNFRYTTIKNSREEDMKLA